MLVAPPTPEDIRRYLDDNPRARSRDAAEALGTGEAALVAAQGATVIPAVPDVVFPKLNAVGRVMALTRNISAVHEKHGIYENYRGGPHASMVNNADIDLRFFAKHWAFGFAVDKETEAGQQRSLQFFDAAGDALHKVFANEGTDLAAWGEMVSALSQGPSPDALELAPRKPVEDARANPEKLDELRREWAKMDDTHQFVRLTSKLKMNRLGAYRIAGAPFVRQLAPEAVDQALRELGGSGIEVILFVGNCGCIQIHTGPLHRVEAAEPWLNVLDPAFHLHLRTDHVAEVWAVEKPTKRGPAYSLEAFAKDGALIMQMFGHRNDSDPVDHISAFKALLDTLPTVSGEGV